MSANAPMCRPLGRTEGATDRAPAGFGIGVEAAVYKIVEEAVTNVMRHASARSVHVSLTDTGERRGELPVPPPGSAPVGFDGVAARGLGGRS